MQACFDLPPREVLLSGAGRVVAVCRRVFTAAWSYDLKRSAAVNTVVDCVVGGDSDKSTTSSVGVLGALDAGLFEALDAGFKIGFMARHLVHRIMLLSWAVPSTPQNRKAANAA